MQRPDGDRGRTRRPLPTARTRGMHGGCGHAAGGRGVGTLGIHSGWRCFAQRRWRLCTMRALVHTDLPPKDLERLANMGITRVGELRKLPAWELGKRFGPALVDYLARLTGQKADPREYIEPPETFRSSVHLLEPIRGKGALLLPMRRLLAELVRWLDRRQLGVNALTWTMEPLSGQPTELSVEFAEPRTDDKALLALSKLKLESAALPRGSRRGDERFPQGRLHGAVRPPVAVDLLAMSRRASASSAELVDSLTAKLGHDAVRGLRIVDDHRPEHAWSFERATNLHRSTAEASDGDPPSTLAVRSGKARRRPAVRTAVGSGAHRDRMVGHRAAAPRLLHRRIQGRRAVLAVPRPERTLVSAWLFLLTNDAVLVDPRRVLSQCGRPQGSPLRCDAVLVNPRRVLSQRGRPQGSPLRHDAVLVDPRRVLSQCGRPQGSAPTVRRSHGRSEAWAGRDKVAPAAREPRASQYAELHAISNFSFLRGASHPEETGAHRPCPRLPGHRHHRRVFPGGCRQGPPRRLRGRNQADRRRRIPDSDRRRGHPPRSGSHPTDAPTVSSRNSSPGRAAARRRAITNSSSKICAKAWTTASRCGFQAGIPSPRN